MHMANTLISPQVGGLMLAVSAGTIGYAVYKLKQNYKPENMRLTAVVGALIFAAQMVNFAIPGTGSSGHIIGAVLLAALLGPYAAFLALSCVLILQAVCFADGGLMALGCNIFNMAFIGCFVAYPLIFKPLQKNANRFKLMLAAVLACIVAAQLGAFCVVLQTLVSGVNQLPFNTFIALMQPIHLAIGVTEGLLTAAALMALSQVSPVFGQLGASKKMLAILCAATVVIGCGFSLFASSKPDGLEWAIERTAGVTELETGYNIHAVADTLQAQSALLPDYTLPVSQNEALGTGVSGFAGSAVTLLALFGFGLLLQKRKGLVKA